jgi:hypothetical protein
MNYLTMKKNTLLFMVLLLLLSACTSGEGNQQADENELPDLEQRQQPEAKDQPEQTSDLSSNQQGQVPVSSVPPGIIPSTDPDERRKEISRGKNDPFSVIPITPNIIYSPSTQPKTKTPPGEVPGSVKPNGTMVPPKVVLAQDDTSAGAYCGTREFQEGSTASIPSGLPGLQPNEARGVLLAGVMQANGTNLAIIKTDDIDYEYSVSEGSYIANGQVLVKRINSQAREPSILLEQYGKEVVRRLGEEPEAQGEDESRNGNITIIQPKGPEVFGRVRGLMLLKVNLQQDPIILQAESTNQLPTNTARVTGTLCNDSSQVITANKLIFQIEDSKGTILDSDDAILGEYGFVLKPGQIGEFDVTLTLKNRLAGDINIKLRDWN